MTAVAGLRLAQGDGAPPSTRASGSAPGESGVAILSLRFRGGVHMQATPQRHVVWFHTSPRVRFDCRLARRALRHELSAGFLAICPAGIDCTADAEESAEAILVAIEPGRLALAAAEEAALDAQLMERFTGSDRGLFECARTLAKESATGFPNGPLFWNDVASGVVDGLLARHSSAVTHPERGRLGQHVFERLKAYVLAHLDAPIDVTALADIAGRSPFHFSHVFARSVGMTPHRYVVHLRVERATDLVRHGRGSLAEIAARTGFADQSHLSRWVRRIHGVSPSELAG